MDVAWTRRAAMAGCAAMLALLVALQYFLTPSRAPAHLFLLFCGLWAFGLVMLRVAPRFGAAGTAAWGIVSAWGAWRMGHDAVLVWAPLAAAALAAAHLAVLLRPRGARA